MAVNYMQPFMAEILEFKAMAAAKAIEFETLRAAATAVRNNQYIETLDDYGCSKWEQILKITPKATDSLEVRRFRIKAKCNEQAPYTYNIVRGQIENLCGADGYSFAVTPASHLVSVRVALTAKGMFDEVGSLLKRVIPANMVIDLSLLYNQWLTLATKKWGDMTDTTWHDARNEVV